MVEAQAFPWLKRLALDCVLLAASLYVLCTSHNMVIMGMALMLLGARQQALGVLAHESVHFLVSKNLAFNEWCGRITFFCIHMDLPTYRAFHFFHHTALGTPDDPELVLLNFGPFFRKPLTIGKLLRHMCYDLCGLGILWYLGFQLSRMRYRPLYTSIHLFSIAAIGLILWQYGYGAYWLWWHVALATTFWIAFRLQRWTEHQEPGVITSSIQPGWLARLLIVPHNIWYHPEHHNNPSLPCWALPSARQEQGQSLRHLLRKLGGK